MRRRAVLSLVGLVAVGGIAWAIEAAIPDERFAYGVAPIGPDEAVLLTRRNEDHATYFWVQLTRRDGTVAWDTALSGLKVTEILEYSGVAASEQRIVLLGEQDGEVRVVGLARDTGERLWEKTLGVTGEVDTLGPALLVDGDRAYAVVEKGDEVIVTALALGDGAVQWTLDARARGLELENVRAALRGPDRLLLTSRLADAVLEIDGATGVLRERLPLDELACVTPHWLVGFHEQQVVLLPRDGAGSIDARVHGLEGDTRPRFDGPCGERESDVIVGTEENAGGRLGVARIDPQSGATRWRLPLPSHGLVEPGESADGTLPRLLPVVVTIDESERADATTKTVVVDLDEGSIRSEHAHTARMVAFMTGERAYLLSSSLNTVYALDPHTGELASATRYENVYPWDARPEDFRFGHLWLRGDGWGRPSGLSWGIYDLASGQPSTLSGDVVATDVTELGWPAP